MRWLGGCVSIHVETSDGEFDGRQLNGTGGRFLVRELLLEEKMVVGYCCWILLGMLWGLKRRPRSGRM